MDEVLKDFGAASKTKSNEISPLSPLPSIYFLPKSAGISPHFSVCHL